VLRSDCAVGTRREDRAGLARRHHFRRVRHDDGDVGEIPGRPGWEDGVVKRLFWLGVGAAAGASGTVWVQQKVRRQIDALGPDSVIQVAGSVATAAGSAARRAGRRVVDRVGDAAAEGRTTMHRREDEMIAARNARSSRVSRPPPGGSAPPDRDDDHVESLSPIRAARR
jgi:hypothetical protein